MIVNVLIVALFAVLANMHHVPYVVGIMDGLTIASLVVGLVFFLGTCVGVLRFPDFFTRLHAAGKGDTLSTILMLFACALYAIKTGHGMDVGAWLVAIKILLIINFIFIGSPTATHALIEAGDNSDVKPWTRSDA